MWDVNETGQFAFYWRSSKILHECLSVSSLIRRNNNAHSLRTRKAQIYNKRLELFAGTSIVIFVGVTNPKRWTSPTGSLCCWVDWVKQQAQVYYGMCLQAAAEETKNNRNVIAKYFAAFFHFLETSLQHCQNLSGEKSSKRQKKRRKTREKR